jgi:hypothetical protein
MGKPFCSNHCPNQKATMKKTNNETTETKNKINLNYKVVFVVVVVFFLSKTMDPQKFAVIDVVASRLFLNFKQINKKSLFSRRAMTGICCSRAEKTQKGQFQLADQPLMLLAANFLRFYLDGNRGISITYPK